MKYICRLCGWLYNEEKGFPEAKWEELPAEFECPNCWAAKEKFLRVEE